MGEPLAPHALREILDAPAPKWARRLGFEELRNLDERVWQSFSPERCRRLANLVVERVRKRIGSAPRTLLARTPGEIVPYPRLIDLSLDTRTHNALQRSRLADRPAVLADTPISRLVSLSGMGAKCLVDILTAWEHGRNRPVAEVAPIHRPEPASALTRARRAVRSDLSPVEIGEPLLNRALERWLEIGGPASERSRMGLAARLGWIGPPPCTLEQAGQIAGVTRERIRQIQKRFEESAPGRFRIASVERAVETIRAAVPIRAERATELLAEEGIASRPIHPEGLLRAARLLGLDPGFEVARLEPIGEVCAPRGAHVDAGLLRQVLSDIKRHARPFGFIDRGMVAAILDEGLGEDAGEIADLLLALDRAQDLGDGWFYLVTDHRQPTVRLIEDMLAVAGGSLTASELRRGLERRLRWRKAGGHLHAETLVPPTQAILSFCRGRTRSFQVRGTRVNAIHPVDWRRRIAPTERTLVETILDAPGHVLHRDEFEAGAVARGVNANTFSVMTSYSPFIKELGGGLWTVRGVEPDPVEVERLRRSRRTRGKHVEGWEWRPDGVLRISIRLRRVTNLVVGIPGAIRRYLAGRAFPVLVPDGSKLGSVRIDRSGASWGYGPALSRLGPAPGDLLLADFDLTSGTVRVGVVPGEDAIALGGASDG